MKKNIFVLISIIILGVFSGRLIYDKISDVYALNIKKDNYVYLLQLGVYKDKNSMENDTVDIQNKLIVKENDNYYVYVGISKKKENLKKISSIYNKLGYNLYFYEREIKNKDFLTNLEQFDILLSNAETNNEIDSINSVILSSYEEMILNK